MQTFFNDVLAQLKGIWSRLDGGQRLIVVVVLAATSVGLGGIVWYAGRPSYEAIRTAHTAEEIVQIRQALTTGGITYTVDNSGRTFLVERSQVGLANMALTEAGFDGSTEAKIGGGFSLIEDAETRTYKLDAASRGQAAAAIQALDGVQEVKVTASKPRRTAAFRDRDKEAKPTATIMLRLRSGASFEGLARSAASLCASQLMIPLENIDVVSSSGAQRWRYDANREAGGGSSEFLAMQRGMGDERTQQAQDGLDRMWPGKTSVKVSVELDPSWEITSQRVLPDEPIVSTEKTSKDTSKPQGGKGGDPSVTSAAPEAAGTAQNNEMRDRTFVTDIGERRTGKMAPDIKRLTVAVLYDRSLESQGFNKDDLVKTVKAIVGWNPERDKDDAFSIMAGEFAPLDFEASASTGPGLVDVALLWAPTVGQILGVLVVVMFLKGLFKRSGRTATGSSGGMSAAAAKADVKEEDLAPEEQQKRMRREIERSIANDPASLAKLLESWLTEQKA